MILLDKYVCIFHGFNYSTYNMHLVLMNYVLSTKINISYQSGIQKLVARIFLHFKYSFQFKVINITIMSTSLESVT